MSDPYSFREDHGHTKSLQSTVCLIQIRYLDEVCQIVFYAVQHRNTHPPLLHHYQTHGKS